MKKTKITFWGVRGSLTSPGKNTAKYGGNTPCLELSYNDTIIICDAGTGIKALGDDLKKRFRHDKKIKLTLLLSHLHLDHLIGLPFFMPLYESKSKINISTPGYGSPELKKHLERLISPPYFPVNILKTPSNKLFREFINYKIKIDQISVEAFLCNHPDGSFAFKFFLPSGKTLVHVSDNEPSLERDEKFIEWLKNTDILIHDAQYTPFQYHNKIGWGHSDHIYPLKLAKGAGIKKVIFFHYDPSSTDAHLDKIKPKLEKFVKQNNLKIKIIMAKEGMSLLI